MCFLGGLVTWFSVLFFLYLTAFAAVNRAVTNLVPGPLGRGPAAEIIFLLVVRELWVSSKAKPRRW